MTSYNEFVNKIAQSVRGFGDRQDMENAVWEAVCGADIDELAAHLETSDDWTQTGHCNDAWAQSYAPNFADADALGDWEGFDRSSVQELCQDVFNELAEIKGIPDEE